MAWAVLLPIPVILLWTSVGAANVAPPTNLTFHCHNFTNTLKWDYDDLKPGLRFRVDIYSNVEPPKELWVDPPALQAEVPYSFNELGSCMLTVTAVIGSDESVPSPGEGITFSYGQYAVVTHTCSVDLPSVDVATKPDDVVVFRFEHPWTVYHQKMSGAKISTTGKNKRHGHISQQPRPPPEFTYDVVFVHQEDKHFTFHCETEVCEQTLPAHAEQQEHCLKFKGEMLQVLFESKQSHCAPPFTEPFNGDVYLYVGISVLALGTAVLIVYMVYCKTTKPASRIPKSIIFEGLATQQVTQPDHVNVLPAEPTTPTPLLTHTDEEDGNSFTPDVAPFPNSDTRLRIGVDQGVSDDLDDLEKAKDEALEYMKGNTMDEDDMPMFNEQSSAYERRAVVLVALGPEELNEGYRS